MLKRENLESLYLALNKRRYVFPDPLDRVLQYRKQKDREVAGLIAASLAYGSVLQIHRIVGRVLDRLGLDLHGTLKEADPGWIRSHLDGFVYRYTPARELFTLLLEIGTVLRDRGSLHASFMEEWREGEETTIPALTRWIRHWFTTGSLISDPARGGACKRLHLYIRWMARKDRVDPGPWTALSPACLVMPVDRHIHRLARVEGITERATADARTALEITRYFRSLVPDDPARYDFVLARIGMAETLQKSMPRHARMLIRLRDTLIQK
ncbi:MAG TPA: TIGR02757 family protein [Thermoanaerobaculia bacterium]|nr:TIGR02757 family protein [Thermoanaerobaculia bacterium]HUM30585.1 TIGR02757 family protein [Thermoanaerobaculia bacterium]HXK68777.1 TIGR02757 family protein [Thermoanaerobaculia bacterium]